jgi:hypothetical protein
MVLRGAYPSGVPCWIDIAWPDVHAVTDFSGGVFDWEFHGRLRRRHADEGVPEGFSDAVAWLATMPSDESADDASPAWGVTFAVDDTTSSSTES